MSDTNEMRRRIAQELNRDPSETFHSASSLTLGQAINKEINAALFHYRTMRTTFNEVKDWFIAPTVAGTRYYSLTHNFIKMDTLKMEYNDSWIFLQERTFKEIDEKDREVTATQGVPYEYTIYQRQLRLWPVANGAYSLHGSYLMSFPGTSLTGSYCASTSTTTTSTASHNNRTNAWFTVGEELIRQRALAAVKINWLRDDFALQEHAGLALGGKPYLSIREMQAHDKLEHETTGVTAIGRLQAYEI